MKPFSRLIGLLPLLVVSVGLLSPVVTLAAKVETIKCVKGQTVVDGESLFFVAAECSADCASFFAKPIPRQDAMAAALIATGKNPAEGTEPPTLRDINIPQGHNCYSNWRCCARAVKPQGSVSSATPAAAAAQVLAERPLSTAVADSDKTLVVPNLGVAIPGLAFTDQPIKASCDSGTCLVIPFLAQYINAFYQFLLGAGMIAASVMFVYGGFIYMLGGVTSKVQSGKKYMVDALVGLCILIGSYVILSTVNPATLTFNALKIPLISRQEQKVIIGNKAYKIGEEDERVKCESVPFDSECSETANGGQNAASLWKYKCVNKVEDCTNMPGPGEIVMPETMGGKKCPSSSGTFCCKIPTCTK